MAPTARQIHMPITMLVSSSAENVELCIITNYTLLKEREHLQPTGFG
jgi:hypothetical protein